MKYQKLKIWTLQISRYCVVGLFAHHLYIPTLSGLTASI